MVVQNTSLYDEAKVDEDVELYDEKDWVKSRNDIDPAMYALASTGRSLQTQQSEQTKATNVGKAFLSGVTLNNYDYQPDDFFSAEGVAKMIGEAVPFALMWQAGAVASGRAVAALNWTMKTPSQRRLYQSMKYKGGVGANAPGGVKNVSDKTYKVAGLNKLDTGIKRATEFEDTWASFVPQVGIEAGLWTGADPTLEGAEGFKQAVAYTAIGQTLGVGINSWLKGREVRKLGFEKKNYKFRDGKMVEDKGDSGAISTIADLLSNKNVDEQAKAIFPLKKQIDLQVENLTKQSKRVNRNVKTFIANFLKADTPTDAVSQVGKDLDIEDFYESKGLDIGKPGADRPSLKQVDPGKMYNLTNEFFDPARSSVRGPTTFYGNPIFAGGAPSQADLFAYNKKKLNEILGIDGPEVTNVQQAYIASDMIPGLTHKTYGKGKFAKEALAEAEDILTKNPFYYQSKEVPLINNPRDLTLEHMSLRDILLYPLNTRNINTELPFWKNILQLKQQLQTNLIKKNKNRDDFDFIGNDFDVIPIEDLPGYRYVMPNSNPYKNQYVKDAAGDYSWQNTGKALTEDEIAQKTNPFNIYPETPPTIFTKGGTDGIQVNSDLIPANIKKILAKNQDLKVKSLAQDRGGTLYKNYKQSTKDLTERNWFQYEGTDAVLAAGTFKGTNVNGGTAWTVQWAKRDNKPVFVYDIDSNKWKTWVKDTWENTDAPDLSMYKSITGVGTRQLTPAGRKAIEAISKTIKKGSVLKSGGAEGSDKAWEAAAKAAGAQVESIRPGTLTPEQSAIAAKEIQNIETWGVANAEEDLLGLAKTIEVSTGGDSFGKKYSALNATFKQGERAGKSIEDVYQVDFKGGTKTGSGTYTRKGKGPIDTSITEEQSKEFYTNLWREYFKENPKALDDIKQKLDEGFVLIDSSPGANRALINQATAIMTIAGKKVNKEDFLDLAKDTVVDYTKFNTEEIKEIEAFLKRNTEEVIPAEGQGRTVAELGLEDQITNTDPTVLDTGQGRRSGIVTKEVLEDGTLGRTLSNAELTGKSQGKDILDAQGKPIGPYTGPTKQVKQLGPRPKEADVVQLGMFDELLTPEIRSNFTMVEIVAETKLKDNPLYKQQANLEAMFAKGKSGDKIAVKQSLKNLNSTSNKIDSNPPGFRIGNINTLDLKINEVTFRELFNESHNIQAKLLIQLDNLNQGNASKVLTKNEDLLPDPIKNVIQTKEVVIEGQLRTVEVIPSKGKPKTVPQTIVDQRRNQVNVKAAELKLRQQAIDEFINEVDDPHYVNTMGHFIFKAMGRHDLSYGSIITKRYLDVEDFIPGDINPNTYIKEAIQQLSSEERVVFGRIFKRKIEDFYQAIDSQGTKLEIGVAADADLLKSARKRGEDITKVLAGKKTLLDIPPNKQITTKVKKGEDGTWTSAYLSKRQAKRLALINKDIDTDIVPGMGPRTFSYISGAKKTTVEKGINPALADRRFRKNKNVPLTTLLGFGKQYDNVSANYQRLIENTWSRITRSHNGNPLAGNEEALTSLIDDMEFMGNTVIAEKLKKFKPQILDSIGNLKKKYISLGQLNDNIVGKLKDKQATLHLVLVDQGERQALFRGNVMPPVVIVSKYADQSMDKAYNYAINRMQDYKKTKMAALESRGKGRGKGVTTRRQTKYKQSRFTGGGVDETKISLEEVGHIEAYQAIENNLNKLLDSSIDLPSWKKQNSAFQKELLPTSREFFLGLRTELDNWIAQGSHGNLDAGQIQRIYDRTLKVNNVDIASLPPTKGGITKEQKEGIRKVIDNLNMVVAGVGLGIRSPNASKIIDKQNVLKQALKDMDKITGYDSARTLAQEDELYANLVNIWDVMKKTGMATDGTREAFETILSAKEGIDALYKSSAHNIDHNVKTIKDAVTRNIKQQKTGVLGKSKYPINNINEEVLAEQLQAWAGARQLRDRMQEQMFVNIKMADLSDNLIKVNLTASYKNMIKSNIGEYLSDVIPPTNPNMLPGSSDQLKFKSRYNQALKDGNVAEQNRIQEEVAEYLIGNESEFIKMADANDYMMKTPSKIYYLERASRGLDYDLTKVRKLTDDAPEINLERGDALADTLENGGHSSESTDLINIKEEASGVSEGGGGMPPIKDLTTEDQNRSWAQYLWSEASREFYKFWERYKNPVFLDVVENMRGANQKLMNFLHLGDDYTNIVGDNFRKMEAGPGGIVEFKKQVMQDPASGIKTDADWEELVSKPTLNLWKITDIELSRVKADTERAFREYMMSTKNPNTGAPYFTDKADGLSFEDWLRRATDTDPAFYDKNVQIALMKFLRGQDSILYVRQQKKLDEVMAMFEYKNKNKVQVAYLRKILAFTKQMKDGVMNKGRREANDFIDELFASGKLNKNNRDDLALGELLRRPEAGTIPGHLPVMLEGDLLIQIKRKGPDGNRPSYDIIGTAKSQTEASKTIKDWWTNNQKNTGEFAETEIIITNKGATTRAHGSEPNMVTLDYDNLETSASMNMGTLKQFFLGDSSHGAWKEGDNIVPYISNHSVSRKIGQNVQSAGDSIDEIIQKLAYSYAKDGYHAKPVAEANYAAYIAETAGHGNAANYIRRWTKGSLGFKSSAEEIGDKIINNTLANLQKFPLLAQAMEKMNMAPGSNRFRKLTQLITSSSSFIALGFNLSTAALQTTILMTNVVPLLGFKNTIKAYKQMRHLDKLGKNATELDKDYKAILDSLGLHVNKNEGTIIGIHNMSHRHMRPNKEGIWQRVKDKKIPATQAARESLTALKDLSMVFFNKGDKYPRIITAIAARNAAEDVIKSIGKKMNKAGFKEDPMSFLKFNERVMFEKMQRRGMTNPDILQNLSDKKVRTIMNEFAVDFTNKTNHSYNATNVPLAFSDEALRPVMQFKTWVQKQSMFWFNMISDRPTKAGTKEQYEDLMYVTGTMVAMGGMFSLPGTQEMDAFMRKIWGVSPKAWVMEQDSGFLDILSTGLAAGAGISLEGRMGPGDLTSTISPENIFGIYPARLFKAGKALYEGNPERALNYTLPKVLQNVRQGYTLARTGELRGTYDKNLLLDYNKMEDNKFYASIVKSIGFDNMDESRYRNLKFALTDKVRVTGRQRAWTKMEVFDLISDGKVAEAKALTKKAKEAMERIHDSLLKERE